jgi:putative ATPase
MKPLAYRVRPKEFSDIVGQDHLVGSNGVITKMLNNDKLCSMILYGPAGCGKTSIAEVISNYYSLSSFSFNASIDNYGILSVLGAITNDNNNYIVQQEKITIKGDKPI